jgi:hypothetical protein
MLIWNLDDKLQYPLMGFSLKFKIGKNSFPISPTSFCTSHEVYNYLIGTMDGNIYKSAFSKPSDSNHDYLFSQGSGSVWRKAVRYLTSNMQDNELAEMKNNFEVFCRDKNIVDFNPEEFFKLKPDINKLYKNSLKMNYEKHISMVTSVASNLFIKGLFLSTSLDGSLRLYNQSSVVRIIIIISPSNTFCLII